MGYTAVTTVFNNETEIIEYLDNMFSQTLPPDNIIITDGGSKDNTINIINTYKEKTNCKLFCISGKRLNIAEGFNIAIKNTKADILAITAIGNKYESNYFEILYNQMIKNGYDICYGPIRGMRKNSFQKAYADTFLHGENGEELLIGSNHGTLIKRSIIEEVGLFYERFYYAGEDTEFYQRASDMGAVGKCVKNAYMEWDTPEDINSYLKQVKVYTIARLQIEKNSLLVKELLKTSFPIYGVLISIIFGWEIIVLTFGFVICLHLLKYYKIRHSNGIFKLWFIKRYYQIYCEIRYCKFARGEYKVKRSVAK